MTWGTTHLGISVILLRTFSRKKFREQFETNKFYFLLASLGAEFPDIDLLIGGHRTWSHSVFFPLTILLILASLPDELIRQRIENWKEINFYLKIFTFLWFTHLLYDLSFGAIAIFYPIDKRLYDITGGIIMVLDSSRVRLGGIFIDVKPVDPDIGKNIFFVNWTAEQRVAYFGTTRLKFQVLDFMVHTTIFVYWLITVAFPGISYIFKRRKRVHIIVEKFKFPKISNSFAFALSGKSKLQAITLISISVAAFTGGPAYGTQWSFEESSDVSFIVLSDNLRLFGAVDFSFPKNANVSFIMSFPQSMINYSVIWGIMNSSIKATISNSTSILIEEYSDGNITYQNFVTKYKQEILQIVGLSWQITNVSLASTYSLTIEPLEETDTRTISFGFAIFEWNISKYFIRSISIEAKYEIPRDNEYWTGWTISVISFAMFVIIIARQVRREV